MSTLNSQSQDKSQIDDDFDSTCTVEMMIRLVSATTRKSLSIDGISSSQNAFATRCFSVRELPWCAPSDSPVRRSKGETEKKGKVRNNGLGVKVVR